MLLFTSIQLNLLALLCIIASSSWFSGVPAQAEATEAAEKIFGGEKAFFTAPPMSPEADYRQDVCGRYMAVVNGTLEMKDALKGMKLNVVVGVYNGSYFNYDPETGIDASYPGIVAVLLDELAQRAGFTWRTSFGLFTDPRGEAFNETWSDVLGWAIEAYDLNADWWATNENRLNMGVAYTKPWYDSSIILIGKRGPEEVIDQAIDWNDFWNWTKPYSIEVWLATFATIVLSGIVYMVLEWFNEEREGRTAWVWFADNLYLSAVNATQAYEYGTPKSTAGKIFAMSMASWALIMTATYTANLASLLVDRRPVTFNIETVEEASVLGYPICVVEGTNADTFIQKVYPTAPLRPKLTLEDMYEGLNSGECAFAADVVQSWLNNENRRKYNPNCDLEWIGGDRVISSNVAGFTTKADAGYKCTGLVRDVINFHMEEMIADEFVRDAWIIENRRNQDVDCETFTPESLQGLNAAKGESDITGRRTLLAERYYDGVHYPSRRRKLKAGRSAAVSAAVLVGGGNGDGGSDAINQMALEAMIGPFAIHWTLMALSILVAIGKRFYKRREVASTVESEKSKSFETEKSRVFESEKSAQVEFCNIMKGRLNEDLEVVSTYDGAPADQSVHSQIEELRYSFGKSEAARTSENQSLQGKMDMMADENQILQEKFDSILKENRNLQGKVDTVMQQNEDLMLKLTILIGQMQMGDESDTRIRHA